LIRTHEFWSQHNMVLVLTVMIMMMIGCEAHKPTKFRRNLKRFDTDTMWPLEVSSFYGFESKFPRSYIPNPLTRRVKKAFREPTTFRSNYSPHFGLKAQQVQTWNVRSSLPSSLPPPWRRLTRNSQDRSWQPPAHNQLTQPESRQDSQGGCNTPLGFRPGGSTWPLPGCGRGVCAITLEGSWVPSQDRCDGLVQNPQYQCFMDEDQSLPFPDCCARPVQCREIGSKSSGGP